MSNLPSDIKPKVVYLISNVKMLLFKRTSILIIVILLAVIAIFLVVKYANFLYGGNPGEKRKLGPLNVPHAINSEGTSAAEQKLLISGIVKEIDSYNDKTKVLHFSVDEDGTHSIYNIISSANTNYQIKSGKFAGKNQPVLATGEEVKVGRKVLITLPSNLRDQQLVASFILITPE